MHGPAVIKLDAWPPGAMVGTAGKARSWSSKGSARGRCARGPGAGDAGGATRTNKSRWRSRERTDVQHVSGSRLAANAARTFLRKRHAARGNDAHAARRAEPMVVEQHLRPPGRNRLARRVWRREQFERRGPVRLPRLRNGSDLPTSLPETQSQWSAPAPLCGIAADEVGCFAARPPLHRLAGGQDSTAGQPDRNQARRVLDYIESNLSHELTLRELAGIADLSLHHFARLFKRTIGVAPYRYVLERRVERAKVMLRTANASLADISLSVGFDSQSHFTSVFGRMVGATPTEFQGSGRKRRR